VLLATGPLKIDVSAYNIFLCSQNDALHSVLTRTAAIFKLISSNIRFQLNLEELSREVPALKSLMWVTPHKP
jgi:hypothetical protein